MSNLLVQNIKHTNNTTAIVVNSSGHVATDTIKGNTSASSISVVGEGGTNTTNLQQGLVKAFVSFDESAQSIFSSQDSFNIGSATDSGTGNYAITFTTNMATIRYTAPGGCYTAIGRVVGTAAEATTGTSIRVADSGGSASDNDCYIAIIGTLS
jgi:hypothetical protein